MQWIAIFWHWLATCRRNCQGRWFRTANEACRTSVRLLKGCQYMVTAFENITAVKRRLSGPVWREWAAKRPVRAELQIHHTSLDLASPRFSPSLSISIPWQTTDFVWVESDGIIIGTKDIKKDKSRDYGIDGEPPCFPHDQASLRKQALPQHKCLCGRHREDPTNEDVNSPLRTFSAVISSWY